MIKILEYLPMNFVKPVGGPSGYLYNLKENFSDEEVKLFWLPSAETKPKRNNPSFLIQLLKAVYEEIKLHRILRGTATIENINFYDAIHFHSTIDLYRMHKQLKDFKGKIILTSHSPCPLHYEIFHDQYSKLLQKMGGNRRNKKYEMIDEYAFNYATNIIFPCKEAEEPYYHLWKKYFDIHKRNEEKYQYIVSGSLPKKAEIKSRNIRESLGLGNNFVISYAGRHTYSKGYDLLVNIGKEFLKRNPDSCFVSCGNNSPIHGLTDSIQWKEIGWTKDASSYINASDVFILPNRETYFDLVLLEVLSLGKIIVASNTGGNKYFSRFLDSGIFLYNTQEEAVEILEKIKMMKKEEKDKLEKENKKIFEEYFSARIFANNYAKAYKSIIYDKESNM